MSGEHFSRTGSRGYVLILTLFLLVIAAVAMVGVVRASMGRALAAVDAQRDLQRRWGTVSCARTLLPRAESILNAAEQRTGRPAAAVDIALTLGGQPFALTVADEQAKLNVNALYESGKRPAVERAARDAAPGLAVRLRPMPVEKTRQKQRQTEVEQLIARLDAENAKEQKNGGNPPKDSATIDPALLAGLDGTGGADDDAPPPPPQAFVGFGQVYDAASADQVRRAAETLTCWGDGRSSLRRAPADVLARLCAPALSAGQVRKLVALRDGKPGIVPSTALAMLKVDGEKIKRLAPRLTRQSGCFSLWIDAGGRHQLSVLARGGEDGPTMLGFDW